MGLDIYVIKVSSSSFAQVKPVPLNMVKVSDRFWGPRLETLIRVTIPSQYRLLEETGRLDNFRIASGKKFGGYRGFWFNDSDVYKWMEAAAYALISTSIYTDKDLVNEISSMIDTTIKDIIAAQWDDGYINTYITLTDRGKRWRFLEISHELYCAGHLIQGAIAVRRALGRDDIYSAAIKFANLIYNTFGYEAEKIRRSDGHPEIEIALVELYRESRDKRYLDLAKFFIDIRGYRELGISRYSAECPVFLSPEYLVDHKPLKDIEDIVGSHAVRALYLFTGATDLYIEIGDKDLWDALKRIWTKVIRRKIYVTGGFGSRYEGESFGKDFELPNDRAYSETCASVAGAMWAWRMFLASGDPEYIDILEQILYNAALAGISLDGKHYFYMNPLEDGSDLKRQKWFECACCPPNIARLIAYMPSMIYATARDSIYVNLFVSSSASIEIERNNVEISMETGYPWDGRVIINIKPERVDEFSVKIRVPNWAGRLRAEVNDKEYIGTMRSFLEIRRVWDIDDKISLKIPLEPKFIEANILVSNNYSKVALKRGPIIYCLEGIDNSVDVRKIVVDPERKPKAIYRGDILGGVIVLEDEGYICEEDGDQLYREYGFRVCKRITYKAIPYYAWNNRGPTTMVVWIKSIPRIEYGNRGIAT